MRGTGSDEPSALRALADHLELDPTADPGPHETPDALTVDLELAGAEHVVAEADAWWEQDREVILGAHTSAPGETEGPTGHGAAANEPWELRAAGTLRGTPWRVWADTGEAEVSVLIWDDAGRQHTVPLELG